MRVRGSFTAPETSWTDRHTDDHSVAFRPLYPAFKEKGKVVESSLGLQREYLR